MEKFIAKLLYQLIFLVIQHGVFEKLVHSWKTFHLTLIGRNRQNELRAIRSCLYRKGERLWLVKKMQPIRNRKESTSHLNMDPRNTQFISIFHGWEIFQPNLKSKLLRPFSVATLLLKHVLFLQPGFFFQQPRRMYYLLITTITLSINLCATAKLIWRTQIPKLARTH